MKQIIAIISDERVEATKRALEAIGIQGITFLHVTGRGEQKGRISAREMAGVLTRNTRMQLKSALPQNGLSESTHEETIPKNPEGRFSFLPKRMLMIIAIDTEINRIIQAIVNVNQTGRHGDGRIFICPMISALRIRTGEQGIHALL